MKVNDILTARNSLAKLVKVKFTDFKTTISVYKLSKKVDEVLDMVQKEQDKIIDIYVVKNSNGKPLIENGNFKFETKENMDKFLADMNKLRSEEVTDIEKLAINLDTIQSGADITTEDIILMEPLISWL